MNDKVSSPNRQKKEKIVAELVEKVNRSKGLVFTSYQGLTHKQLEGLKKKVKSLDADFVATKNTLLKLSLSGNQTLNSPARLRLRANSLAGGQLSTLNFQNATATLFLYGDPVGPLKEIAKAIKEFNLPASPAGGQGGPTIKFGILDGIQMTSDQLIKLSTLPNRETLLTQLVFGLKSPISGLHRALNWNLQKLVMTLRSIENSKK